MRKVKLMVLIIFLWAAVIVHGKVSSNYGKEVLNQIIGNSSKLVWAEHTQLSSAKNKPAQDIRTKIYNYLLQEKNRNKVLKSAFASNKGRPSNACVYFVSETLRRNGVNIPKGTCNSKQLLAVLSKRGWKKERDYKKLQPGDICFSTDFNGSKMGKPSHSFIFMGWVKPNNYDYAYICDNQVRDYKGKVYHIRNIKGRGRANGYTKEAFSFFMKPS